MRKCMHVCHDKCITQQTDNTHITLLFTVYGGSKTAHMFVCTCVCACACVVCVYMHAHVCECGFLN